MLPTTRCLQVVHDGSRFNDRFDYVTCGGCDDRITVEKSTYPDGTVEYYYTDHTVLIGLAGLVRACCTWECAAKVARKRTTRGRK